MLLEQFPDESILLWYGGMSTLIPLSVVQMDARMPTIPPKMFQQVWYGSCLFLTGSACE